MALNIKAGINLKYTDETGTYYLFEGDKVICHVGEKIYNGTISWIGVYKEKSDSEPEQVICIDTLKSKTSISREIIKIKNITYICKNPFYDNKRPFGNEQDFMDTFIENGYSKEQAKAVCDRMSDATVFYNVPYAKATAYALEIVRQKITSDKCNDKDVIMEFAKQCMEETEKEYFELVEMYLKVIEQCDRDESCLKDTFDIVSKCWSDLSKQKTDRTEGICKN